MATELAQAYVQIIPSARGISNKLSTTLNGQMGSAGASSGSSFSSKFATVAKVGLAAAGVALGKLIMSSINEGAALQQSIGGIETLFKSSSDKMIQQANNAYKTAGLSANAYMEQATSFSASLLQAVGGDTDKAAKAANTAIIDMSDNSNKMGTSMELIQNAYQGFAKGSYVMLDNLKLGYGGTKTEMERLLADAEKISGVKYDINNLNDVYSAIHVVQGELGITGTTAKESASTFSGSFASMKGAVSNFLGNLALGDKAPQSMEKSLSAVLKSIGTFLFDNALPMIGNILSKLPGALLSAATSMVDKFTTMITDTFEGKNNKFLLAAGKALLAFIKGLLIGVGKLALAGGKLVLALIKGILGLVGKIGAAGKTLMLELVKKIKEKISDIKNIGKNIVIGLWQGITNKFKWIIDKIKGFVNGIKDKLKKFFHIKSPSKWARDEVGRYLAEGIGVGFAESMNGVRKQMEGALPTSFNTAPTIRYNTLANNSIATSPMQAQGGQSAQPISINFTGDLAALGRVLKPVIDRENKRIGKVQVAL
jgi:phage-related protein